MMTIQQTAILVGRQNGLPSSFDGSVGEINALPEDQKVDLTAGIGAYIRANGTEFTDQQLAVARSMPTDFGLQDSSFSVGDFLAATADNAENLIVDPLVNIGQSASLVARWVPLVAIVIGGYLLYTWTKAKGAAVAS